jgi:hypothetical protein
MGVVIAIVVGYIVATEKAKAWFYRAKIKAKPRFRRTRVR